MEYSVISSRNNDRIKYVKKLVTDASLRRESGLFTLEGARLCADAVRSGYDVRETYITQNALEKYRGTVSPLLEKSGEVFVISDEVADKLSDTVSTQGVFSVVKAKKNTELKLLKGARYLALENVQNPQNLGSVARTAEALGIDALITFEGCDIYNPKALRASMGSLMRIPVCQTDSLASLINEANAMGILTLATVPDANATDITTVDFSHGVLTVIGNEGNGISPDIQSLCSVRATIKMKGEAESLNAWAAAIIAMWEMMR